MSPLQVGGQGDSIFKKIVIRQPAKNVRGCKVLVGKAALDAEIGKLERLKEEAGRKIKQLKHAMGEME